MKRIIVLYPKRPTHSSFLSGVIVVGICLTFWGCSAHSQLPTEAFELRGVWVQAKSITTPEAVDETLARVEAGRFNTIFVNVFIHGHPYYESVLVEKNPDLAPGYDPLAYVLEEAHRRGIQVHAWFVVGPMPESVLSRHPEWALVDADNQQHPWYNFVRPEARQFVSDLVLEVVENYAVDGLHLDYIRYPFPGLKWGLDPYSIQDFAERYSADLELLRGSGLPAFALFAGNPLVGVQTAQVLVEFDNGRPAVLLNTYGQGEVILLNWNATARQVAVESEIMRRSINYLLGEYGDVYVLRSETNAEKYGLGSYYNVSAWIDTLGWTPREMTEVALDDLDVDSVLVMPNIYLITPQAASSLADFVHAGGAVIFVDGPVGAIQNKGVQAITGMQREGVYFEETALLVASGEHQLIPPSSRESDLEAYQTLYAQWIEFRKRGVSSLVQNIYRRVKEQDRQIQVTAAVFFTQELADQVLQDWPAWLAGGYVDVVIPMAYVEHPEALVPVVVEWKTMPGGLDRIAPGLAVVVYDERGREVLKTSDQVFVELVLMRAEGANRVVLFDLEHVEDSLLQMLATGPFSWSDASCD
jgi:uncharacterized lipoprotein YddW (UPF0748 family)